MSIDYEKEKAALGSLVTIGAFKAWLEGLRKRTDAPGLRTGIDRWIERVGKMDPAKSLATVKGEIGNLYGIGLNLLNQAAGKPTEYGAAWVDELLPDVDLDFGAMWASAQSLWRKPVEANPERYRPEAERYLKAMDETRKILNAWKPLVKSPSDAARYNRIAAEWARYQGEFRRDADVGIAPLLVIGAIALGAGALAWAVAYWERASALKTRAQAELEDVRSRDAASREGRVVAPSTLPPPPPQGDGLGLPGWVLPAAGLAAAGGVTWWLLGRKTS